MKFTKEQKNRVYKQLPLEVQNFIMDPETTELINNSLLETGISDNFTDDSDSEILYAMYGLQDLNGAIESISKITGKNVSELTTLKTKLENNIFSKIQKLQSTNKKIDPSLAKKRISEIVSKYGLNPNQATALENKVSETNENIKPSDLMDLLNISNLLAEQIVTDLEKRVFEPALKQIETNSPKVNVPEPRIEPRSEYKPEPKPITTAPKTEMEIRPDILPTETMQGANFVPTPKPAFQNDTLDRQKPSGVIGVPRYASDDTPTKPPVSIPVKPPVNNPPTIVENKLNSMTVGSKPPEKYQKDPYREPLE